MATKTDYLEKITLFEGLAAPHKKCLAEVASLQSYKKKSYLFHEGEEGQRVFLLVSGDVQLHKTSTDGKEVVIKVVRPGELFAEVILFEQTLYPVTAQALTDSLTLTIPRAEISLLLEQAEFRNDFIGVLLRKQRYLSERIHYLTAYNVEDRLRMFLREHYGQEQEILCLLSKKDIAAAIGATPESLSRLLLRLEELDLLHWDKQIIRLNQSFWT